MKKELLTKKDFMNEIKKLELKISSQNTYIISHNENSSILINSSGNEIHFNCMEDVIAQLAIMMKEADLHNQVTLKESIICILNKDKESAISKLETISSLGNNSLELMSKVLPIIEFLKTFVI